MEMTEIPKNKPSNPPTNAKMSVSVTCFRRTKEKWLPDLNLIRNSAAAILVFLNSGLSLHEKKIKKWLHFIENIEKSPRKVGTCFFHLVLQFFAQRIANAFLIDHFTEFFPSCFNTSVHIGFADWKRHIRCKMSNFSHCKCDKIRVPIVRSGTQLHSSAMKLDKHSTLQLFSVYTWNKERFFSCGK